jgi:hypothetical protein
MAHPNSGIVPVFLPGGLDQALAASLSRNREIF